MLLRIADIDWKDTVVSVSNSTDWLSKKGDYEKEALGSNIKIRRFFQNLGSLPILRLNGQTYYQTEAIIEWATAKAGLTFDCPVMRMKVRKSTLLTI